MVTPIEQRFMDKHQGSADRHEKAKDLFPDGVTHDARRQHPFQLYYTHAIGPHGFRALIRDSEGNRIALHSNTDA